MRKMYKVENETISFPMVTADRMVVGDRYLMTDLISQGEFRGLPQYYMYEMVIPKEEALTVTDSKGGKPFAITTNDSIRDNFPPGTLAKVLLSEGQFVLYAYPADENAPSDVNYYVNVFRIYSIASPIKLNVSDNSITMDFIHRFAMSDSTSLGNPTNLDFIISEALTHTIAAISDDFSTDYIRNKYCFNPGRIVQHRLFIRDGKEFISYGPDGKKLTISRNSRVFESFDPNADSLFMRCFYSKKYAADKSVFVDGAPVIMLPEEEMQEYIAESYLTDESAKSLIQKTFLKTGYSFFAIVNDSGIRPIYKSSYGYATFKLSNQEVALVDVDKHSPINID